MLQHKEWEFLHLEEEEEEEGCVHSSDHQCTLSQDTTVPFETQSGYSLCLFLSQSYVRLEN